MLKRKASVPVVSARQVLGFLDRIDEAGFGGWVVDFSSPGKSLRIRILIDDVIVDVVNCDLHRDDAALLKLATRRIGFYYNIPARYHDGLRHVVKFGTLDGAPIMMSSRSWRSARGTPFLPGEAHPGRGGAGWHDRMGSSKAGR